MSLAENGLFNKLLDYAWLEEPTATLPADLVVLSKLTGVDRRILSKFTGKYPGLFRESPEDSQRLYNPRQMSEYQEFLQTVEKNRLAGLASAKARQSKSTGVGHPLNHKELDLDVEVRTHQTPPLVSPESSLEQATKSAAFDVFWEKWPRKQNKTAARRAWMKVPLQEYGPVMTGLEKWLVSDQWQRGVIPHPATWLNAKRWQDEDIPQFGGGSNGSTKKLTGDALTAANLRAAGFVQ